MLHLIKLSVGTEDIADLRRWQQQRRRQTGALFHRTRMMPRRREDLLAGGSIYWVVKGIVRARQRLTAIEAAADEEGRACTLLHLDDDVVPTMPRAHRPFQGWRYLPASEAPPDLADLPAGVEEMPAEMTAALHELGLL